MIELPMFIMVATVMFAAGIMGYLYPGLPGIISSLLSAILAFMCSKIIINGEVGTTFSGIATNDTMQYGARTVESAGLSYVFLFIALVMVVVFVIHTINEVNYQLSPDIGGEIFE